MEEVIDPIEFPRPQIEVPFVTTQQMREVDRLMEEDYGVHLLQFSSSRNLRARVG